MRRRIALALALAGVAAVGGILCAAILALALVDAHRVIAAAVAAPPAATVIEPAPETPDGVNEPQASWPSNLPPEYIAGLPEYTAIHDSETYIRVQTWIRLCMRDQQGYSYMYDGAPDGGSVVGLVSMTFVPMADGFDQSETLALYGAPHNLGAGYQWERGGCYGQAIHKAGLLGDEPSFTDAELEQIRQLYEMAYPPRDDEPGT